jgi:hypothetical protein
VQHQVSVVIMVYVQSWRSAFEEHDRALRSFIAACERVPSEKWHLAHSPGKWSPADVALHLCHAYELACDTAAGAPGMRMLVTRRKAWALRTLLLPVILSTGRFPQGVPAPEEVIPDRTVSNRLTRDDTLARLERAAQGGAEGLESAAEERPTTRVMHAYFGALTPLTALRLLSAHTRHHARGLARQSGA